MGLIRLEYLCDELMFSRPSAEHVRAVLEGERDAEVLAWNTARRAVAARKSWVLDGG